MFDLDFLKTCTAGFDRMTDEAQNALRGIVQLMQKPDGLFPDRSGRGDLYYTLFGLCLAYVESLTSTSRSLPLHLYTSLTTPGETCMPSQISSAQASPSSAAQTGPPSR